MGTSAAPSAGGTPFDALNIDDAAKRITEASSDVAKTNKLFLAGDHWQGGAGWIGPMPTEQAESYQRIFDLVAKGFTSKNVIAEITERHMSGIIGREPQWGYVPRDTSDVDDGTVNTSVEDDVGSREAAAAMREWWNSKGVHQQVQKAVMTLLASERAPFRLFVPRGRLVGASGGAGTISAATLSSALNLIFPEALDIETATVITDEDTKLDAGIRVVEVAGKKSMDATFLAPHDPGADAAVAPPLTVMRSVGEGYDAIVSLDFGGRLPMYEMRRPLLITTQIQQAQRAINLAISMIPRNVTTSGFLERVITNAQMPGKYETVNGEDVFIPSPPKVGAGYTTFLRGETVEQDDGRKTLATTGVHWRSPTPVTPSVEAKRSHYEDALEEADQAHILISGDATASGKSREQARADYEMSLVITSGVVVPFLRWLFETALAMAEAFVNNPGQFTREYRAEASCNINSGPISVEERAQNVTEVDKRMLSIESAMSRNGVADPQAERARIDANRDSLLEHRTSQAEVLRAFVDAGVALNETLLGMVGLTAEEARAILDSFEGGGDPEAGNVGDGDDPAPGDGGDPSGGAPPPASGGAVDAGAGTGSAA